jgi:hypothetical protein
LDQFIDPDIPDDPSWTPDAERSRQLERLTRACAITLYVRDWTGRLNRTEHTRQERSEDKKVARRVTSRLMQAILTWGGSEELVYDYSKENEPEIRKAAATLVWPEWWEKHRVEVSNNLRRVSTLAQRNGYIRDGNRFGNTFSNEYRSLDDVVGMLESSSDEE